MLLILFYIFLIWPFAVTHSHNLNTIRSFVFQNIINNGFPQTKKCNTGKYIASSCCNVKRIPRKSKKPNNINKDRRVLDR